MIDSPSIKRQPTPAQPDTEKLLDTIEQQIEEFFANGGEITKVPPEATGVPVTKKYGNKGIRHIWQEPKA